MLLDLASTHPVKMLLQDLARAFLLGRFTNLVSISWERKQVFASSFPQVCTYIHGLSMYQLLNR